MHAELLAGIGLSSEFWASSTRLGLPLILAALGGILAERSGVINVGMEGMMLVGAFLGYAVAVYTDNLALVLFAVLAGGALLGVILGLVTISLPGDQVVAGVALSLFCLGMTSYLDETLFGVSSPQSPIVVGALNVPLISKVPLIGPLLFQQSAFVYIAIAIALAMTYILRRAPLGLEIRAVGEDPDAATSMGLSVLRTRFACIAISGALAALGGAFLSLVENRLFLDGETNGIGYIALALIVLGRRHPIGVFGAGLLFGAANALSFQGQLHIHISVELIEMLPYVLAVVVLCGFVRPLQNPRALGSPWLRE